MLDGIGRRLPLELGFPIDGVRPELPFPFGNHDPPITGTLPIGRVVGGGVFPTDTLLPGRLDSPGDLPVRLFPKFGFNVGFAVVPDTRPVKGLPTLIEFEPLPNAGLL